MMTTATRAAPAAAPPAQIGPSPAVAEPVRRLWTRTEMGELADLGFFEGERVMLIDGDLLVMSRMNPPHANGINFTLQALQSCFGGGFTFRIQMPMDFGESTDPEPDVAVLSGPPRSNLTTPAGALLVVEVSDTSLAYDLGDKSSLYASAGVEDYWVLDVVNKRLHVLRHPRPDAAERFGHRYHHQTTLGPSEFVTPLAAPSGAAIAVGELLP